MGLIQSTTNKLKKEQNKLIKKKSDIIAKMQKLKVDSEVISNKINDINKQMIKMQKDNEVVLMAIASGSETSENSGVQVKLFTGLVPLSVLAVNPTKKELEAIYGRELEKEPEYFEIGVKRIEAELAQADFLRDGDL